MSQTPTSTGRLFCPELLELLDRIRRAVQDRATQETQLEARYRLELQQLRELYATRQRTIDGEFQQQVAAIQGEHEQFLRDLENLQRDYRQQYKALKQKLKQLYRRYRQQLQAAQDAYEKGLFESESLLEATRTGLMSEQKEYEAQLKQLREQLLQKRHELLQLLGDWSIYEIRPTVEPLPETDAPALAVRRQLEAQWASVQETLATLWQLPWVRCYRRLIHQIPAQLLAALAGLAGYLPLGLIGAWAVWFAAATFLGGMAQLLMYLMARRQLRQVVEQALGKLDWIEAAIPHCWERLQQEAQNRWAAEVQRHRTETQRWESERQEQVRVARQEWHQARYELRNQDLVNLRRLQHKIEAMERQGAQQQEERRRTADTTRQTARAELEAWYADRLRECSTWYERARAEIAEEFRNQWAAIQACAAEWWRETRSYFPEWQELDLNAWSPPSAPPPYLLLGTLSVAVDRLPEAKADWFAGEDRLEPLRLPALVPFPLQKPLLLEVSPADQACVLAAMRSLVARFLMAFPPGRGELVLLDPAGLGDSFAGFMHLADYDPKLVGGRIWTQAAQVERQLAEVTAQLEETLQRHLRHEFPSLVEYNRAAGDVAEPWRLVVVSEFPNDLSDPALKKLAAIAATGPRCGVQLLLVGPRAARANESPVARSIRQESVCLRCTEGRRVWQVPELETVELELEAEPPDEVLRALLHCIGALAQASSQVQVPFELILTPRDQWWQASSRDGLVIPLGVAGATRTQLLNLGQGTRQHVLIAGRTGSGKSNLLHVIITAGALRYSPRELQLYLVDFKKGVEFSKYASFQLPHARVIAIESEREFGLSVLQQLHQEMQRRGDLFREARVHDLPSYRALRPQSCLPRILLIVDEFQEFFVEDDRIAQEASLLLDRLVRQGRAFGIHVILGSQTLSGTYALARSTISQMGIRIALQCSESDSQLILSDDNPGARLLHRPGEAIYNDANGLVEGNYRFQVAWLPEPKRESYLATLRQMATEAGYEPPAEMIVFEGNAPAELPRFKTLLALLNQETWPDTIEVPRVWLGESVETLEPTEWHLERRSRSHAVMVGTDRLLATGLTGAALLSLAVQIGPAAAGQRWPGVEFVLLDESERSASQRHFWRSLQEALPHPVRISEPGQSESLLRQVWDEFTRRAGETAQKDWPFLFLVLFDLGRLRYLRLRDEFPGFGERFELGFAEANPSEQFDRILREGTSFKIFVLAWAETAHDLQRVASRSALLEFGCRIVFPMSAGDSVLLIESPAAAKLGRNRALLYRQDTGRLVKFRPFGPPPSTWLEAVGKTLKARLAQELQAAAKPFSFP